MIYRIHEGNMERLEKKASKIQAKCRRFGCDFKFETLGEEYKMVTDENGNECYTKYFVVDAEGTAVINDWKLIGSVETTPKGNIVTTFGKIEVPSKYYTSKCTCEHCNINRVRKDTFILLNEVTGEFKQVGRTCLTDFTHGMSIESATAYVAAFDEIIKGETPCFGSSFRSYINVKEFLVFAAETIRHFGYVKSDGINISTAERAHNFLRLRHHQLNGVYFKAIRDEYEKLDVIVGFDENSPEAISLVDNALAWLDTKDESSNYFHNLKVACALEFDSGRNLNLLASLFVSYDKHLIWQQKIAAQKSEDELSTWKYQVGNKVEIEVESVKCVTSWESNFGPTFIWKIVATDKNIYVWKTGKWMEDDTKKVKGTVKELKEYRGVKQTELTRCRCV